MLRLILNSAARTTSAVVAGAAFALFLGPISASAQPVVPTSAYSQLPNAQSVRISPDGTRLAFVTGAERDATFVVVTALDGSTPPISIPGFSRDIRDGLLFGVDWLSDRHILIVYRTRVALPGQPWDTSDVGRQIIWDLETGEWNELALNASIVSLMPDDPGSIMVSANVVSRQGTSVSRSRTGTDQARVVNLFRYDLSRGNYQRVAQGTADTVNWVLGQNYEPIIRQDRDASRQRWRIFDYEGRRANLIYEESYTVERFGRSGRRAISRISNLVGEDYLGRGIWFSQLESRDKLRAYLLNPASGEVVGPVIAPEQFDFGGFRTDWRTGKVIGAFWLEQRRRNEWFDPEFASLQEQLDGLFPRSEVVIGSWDRSGQKLVINVSGGETTNDFYLLDREAGELNFLTTAHPDVPPERVHPVSVVHYSARDGLDLWGYLTLPNDRPAEALPLVIVPHGGPQARDTYGFDELFAQPYADMGYAVFQPNFRGSSGMGLAFVRRGHGEWGRLMQSDITDAVKHLVDQGIADPDRVCIWGWSYGGYAALAGWALTPDMYRCAIAGAPVSDILRMMSWQADQLGGAGAVNYWTEYIGDWRVQRDEMIAISPARQAANGTSPLLLIHPREDVIVPIEQSDIMLQAARAAGQNVEMIAIDGDGHNLLFARTRHQTIEAVRNFLMEHNPPVLD